MNTTVVGAGNIAEMKWRKLNEEEKAKYGSHTMVVGFADCCPRCHEKNLRVVSDTGDPGSRNVYLENHKPHHENEKIGHSLCPASEVFINELNLWMRGEIHLYGILYDEFVAIRFPDTTVS